MEIDKQNNYNMKNFIKSSQAENKYILESNTQCTTACCPAPQQTTVTYSSKPFKKDKKFIYLTINKHKQPLQPLGASDPSPGPLFRPQSTSSLPNSQQQFKQEKTSFLQQIRKYSPNPQFHKEQDRQRPLQQQDSTKQLDITPKTNENSNLSSLLQNLSNQIFSDMFVCSTIKEKIMMSGSLGSISEVKSEMEISNPTETIINNLQFTEQR